MMMDFKVMRSNITLTCCNNWTIINYDESNNIFQLLAGA